MSEVNKPQGTDICLWFYPDGGGNVFEFITFVGPWHEAPDKSWREMYEELRDSLPTAGGQIKAGDVVVAMPQVLEGEVQVKPHKRHKPRKKILCMDCGLPLGEDGFCDWCAGRGLQSGDELEGKLDHPDCLGDSVKIVDILGDEKCTTPD